MKIIYTVLGEISGDMLGHCQIHEHIYVKPTPASKINQALCIDDKSKSIAELKDYKAAGGGTILDAQPIYAGRYAELLPDISRESGVQIIASTGYHLSTFYDSERGIYHRNEIQLSELFISECRDGIRTECDMDAPAVLPFKAGAIKAAITSDNISGAQKKMLFAAATAAKECKRLLFIHTEAGYGAHDAIMMLRSILPSEQIMICHADRQTKDYSMHEKIADTGAYLDYDTIARHKYHDDEEEVKLIRHMLSRGYQKQIMLSMDTTSARLLSYGGEFGLKYILTDFVPMLKEAGVSDAALDDMTKNNAVNALSQC